MPECKAIIFFCKPTWRPLRIAIDSLIKSIPISHLSPNRYRRLIVYLFEFILIRFLSFAVLSNRRQSFYFWFINSLQVDTRRKKKSAQEIDAAVQRINALASRIREELKLVAAAVPPDGTRFDSNLSQTQPLARILNICRS